MLIAYDLTNVLQEFFFHIAFRYFWMKVNLRHSYFSQCYPQSFDGWSWSYYFVYYYFILIVVGAEIRRGDPSALKVIISVQLPIHVIITTSMSMPLVHMERNWGKELSDHHYHYRLKPLIWFCVISIHTSCSKWRTRTSEAMAIRCRLPWVIKDISDLIFKMIVWQPSW